MILQPVFKIGQDSEGMEVGATDTNKVTNLSKAKVSQQRKEWGRYWEYDQVPSDSVPLQPFVHQECN